MEKYEEHARKLLVQFPLAKKHGRRGFTIAELRKRRLPSRTSF
jgi:hypothetical protein